MFLFDRPKKNRKRRDRTRVPRSSSIHSGFLRVCPHPWPTVCQWGGGFRSRPPFLHSAKDAALSPACLQVLSEICREYKVLYLLSAEEYETQIQNNATEIKASGYFESPTIYNYPWSQSYTLDQFLGFLMTGNGYLALSQRKEQN